MIALDLEGPADLAEAMYFAFISADNLGKGVPLWRDLQPEERARWLTTAARLIALYPARG